MTNEMHTQLKDFDLLSQPAQQRLRARVADAHGDLGAVAAEVRAQLEACDAAAQSSSDQADRAFLVAQVAFLDALAQATQTSTPARRPGIMARIRTLFHQRETAK
jgi:hypothetical protein